MATDFDIAREVVYNVYAYNQKNPSAWYSKHAFISLLLDRLTAKVNVAYPMKWFFSTYVRYTPKRANITKKAFEKLLIVGNPPDQETAQFKAFAKELKKKASQNPWFSKAFQGCLKIGNRCIFNRSDAKVSFSMIIRYFAVNCLFAIT
jgi:hypothetical protein